MKSKLKGVSFVTEQEREYCIDSEVKKHVAAFLEKLKKLETNTEKITFLKKELKKIKENEIESKSKKESTSGSLGDMYDNAINKEIEEKYKNEISNLIEEYKEIGRLDEEEKPKNGKDTLTHKQQILLLNYLGVFDNEKIKGLSNENKGLLFGALLNRHDRNTENYIRYLFGKNAPKEHKCGTPQNISTVNKLLKACKLDEIPQ